MGQRGLHELQEPDTALFRMVPGPRIAPRSPSRAGPDSRLLEPRGGQSVGRLGIAGDEWRNHRGGDLARDHGMASPIVARLPRLARHLRGTPGHGRGAGDGEHTHGQAARDGAPPLRLPVRGTISARVASNSPDELSGSSRCQRVQGLGHDALGARAGTGTLAREQPTPRRNRAQSVGLISTRSCPRCRSRCRPRRGCGCALGTRRERGLRWRSRRGV
jgi:hypothetical protein